MEIVEILKKLKETYDAGKTLYDLGWENSLILLGVMVVIIFLLYLFIDLPKEKIKHPISTKTKNVINNNNLLPSNKKNVIRGDGFTMSDSD